MHKHSVFNLYIHEDWELASHLSGEVLERETLHEWPLSCVERVTTTQGQWIYKSQFGPTVEAEFYAAARSSLLGQTRTIYCADGRACTLRDHIDAPLIEELDLSEAQAALMARQVRTQMDEIRGDLPFLHDIRTPEQWLALSESALQDVATLIKRKQYTVTTWEMVQGLQRWAHGGATLEAVQRHPGYVHGDLTGDNVFVLPDGSYRVIDWQRPFYGPTELDIASMIESLGYDPLIHVPPGIVQVRCFMLIQWVTDCAMRWCPLAARNYDRLTADWASRLQSFS